MNLPRPPVVTILGHVDHGKTTLLDYIRKINSAEKEVGGITQKIGAYEIFTKIKGYNTDRITFIDTPGHEAFNKLRMRGANAADLAILIIDAKDSVMPQTAESITHIKAAKIPFIVVINKIDLPTSNPEKVKNDLMKYEVLVEDKGGHVPLVLISAKTGKGVTELLETILLVTSDLNLRFSPQNQPYAVIIETKKDKRGIVASAIIKDGKLKIGDTVFIEDESVKIRSLINDRAKTVTEVLPSSPFELLGFTNLPHVGAIISDKPKIHIADKSPSLISQTIDLESLLHPKKEEQKLSILIKADSLGSLEAITDVILDNPHIQIIFKAVGEIYKSDIIMAKSTKAIVIGFNVSASNEAKEIAKQEKVIIKTYNIIYNLIDEVTEVSNLLREKQQQERSLKGAAKIIASFIIEGEKVFGVTVTKGKINLNDELEIFRNDQPSGKTKLISLKIRAKPVDEVKKDQEAGMLFSPPLDIKVGDVVKSIL